MLKRVRKRKKCLKKRCQFLLKNKKKSRIPSLRYQSKKLYATQ